MNRNKYKHIMASLAISALLLAGLFLLQNRRATCSPCRPRRVVRQTQRYRQCLHPGSPLRSP